MSVAVVFLLFFICLIIAIPISIALGIVSDIDRVAGGVLRVEHGVAPEVVDGESLLLQSLDIVVVRGGIGAAHLDVERARAIPLALTLGGFRLGQLPGQIGRRP